MLFKCLVRRPSQFVIIINSLKQKAFRTRSLHLNNILKSTEQQISVNGKAVIKSTKKSKVLLYSVLGLGVVSLVYFELALDSKEQRKVRILFSGIGRAIRSLRTGVAIGVDYKWSLWGLDEDGKEYDQEIKKCHARTGDRMAKACIKNGGIYVKLGQAISTMNEILPKELCTNLRVLQTQALRSEGTDQSYYKFFSKQSLKNNKSEIKIDQLFQEDFHQSPKDLFKEFDYKPIAAASLAQVHKAITHEGEKVAVKLQYLDLRDRFPGDVLTVKFIMNSIGWWFRNFNMSWVLEDLQDRLIRELDFINECNNSRRCYNELKYLGFVYVPKVIEQYTTERVLTMEFIDAPKINDVEHIKKLGLDLKEVDEKLVKLFAEQIFHTGFVHADPHHGNIFVRKLNGTNKAEIVLIDHGLYEYVKDADRKNLCKLWKYTILKNEEKMKLFAKKLNVDDYVKLSEILMMEPPLSRVKGLKFKSKLTDHDIYSMREKVRNEFDKIQLILKKLNRCMLLILRNLNTVRSIVFDHGNLVDRHTIMARSAIFGAYKDELKLGFTSRIKAWFELKMFDFILFYDRLKRWTSAKYFQFAIKMRWIPSELIREVTRQINAGDIMGNTD